MLDAVAKNERIGLVLSGGGARGAYEAGVMSVLGPALDARGERPTIYIGTSVGAVNATYQAAAAHLPAPEEAAGRHRALAPGREEHHHPADPDAPGPADGVRYLGEIMSLPGVRLPSLLDPKPFERNLDRWINWDDLHRNVESNEVAVVGTVATAARTGRTVVFVEGDHERVTHRSHAIDYVPTQLDEHHVRASAAIPILFPPVRVDEPARRARLVRRRRHAAEHADQARARPRRGAPRGGRRPTRSRSPRSRSGRHDMQPPDFGDGALHVLQGMLVDPVVEDMRILGNINMFFANQNGGGRSAGRRAARRASDAATERYRAARGKKPYRMIPYIFIAPEKRGAIGRLASEVFKDRYGGWKGLRSVDFPLLNRLLGGESPQHGELLSYLFFDREFIEELIRMGARDARRWLRADPGPERPVADRAAGRVHAPGAQQRHAGRRSRRPRPRGR